MIEQSPSILRKEMELELVKLIEKYRAQGLDFSLFTIDTSQEGIVDARVILCPDPVENLDAPI
ncbi:hypothetical protein [Acinetobacter baumannii]|uniref:hypothetical protein n=1 Tax=Acinetobacter baumannii TaxID=470 RepID=UPI000DEC8A73|nr:hypothetical protein [Acinetobacter baumannii]EHU1961523.1 hypothetical protein [Acinetobacter baumannii]MBF8379848.1 hypothetical protein [Acinetobacter baumannii]MBJ3827425.1 hypothetical protein [Acinetobacter baumannii]MBP3075275.1 hypothetical protein [Acinetobacter baumannii]MBP5081273.1 hypothetical protein [Acinetobacter baumannii]